MRHPLTTQNRSLIAHSRTLEITELTCISLTFIGFCQNWEINQKMAGDEPTVAELATMMLKPQDQECHNINFVSPSHVVVQILEALSIAAGEGLKPGLLTSSGRHDILANFIMLTASCSADFFSLLRKTATKLILFRMYTHRTWPVTAIRTIRYSTTRKSHMIKKLLQSSPLLCGLVLSFVYLNPAAAFPLQHGMQIVADPQLQACLDQAITANNWTATEEVTALICPNQAIQTADGIGQLVNLNQLNLSGNHLRHTFEFDQLSQLTALDLSNNKLSDIAQLSSLQQLQQLYLNGNYRLNGFAVETVIQNNPGLTHLGVAEIQFENLTHSWLPPYGPSGEYNLIELDISRTGPYFYFDGLAQYPSLKVLKAAGLQMTYTQPLQPLVQLEVVDLSDNRLAELSGLQMLTGLQQLNVGGNSALPATEVQMVVQNNPGLTHLGVADIQFGTDLSWLPPAGPMGEFDLVELDISRSGQYLDLYPLTQYPNLKVLKAAGNDTEFTGPVEQLQQLEAVDLSGNRLNDVYSLQSLHNIRQLDLSGNSRLQAPDLQMLLQNNPGLTHLAVADINLGNDLTWLPPAGPMGEFDLVELDLSRTGHYIDLYPLVQYANLKVVSAAGNQIEYTAPFDQLQRLETLDVSDNELHDLYGLQGLNTLRQLNLNGNSRLQSAEVQMLIQSNPDLTHLSVADIQFGTDLNWLPPTGPMGEFDLVELDISRTGHYIDLYPLVQYANLKAVKASGNRIEYTAPFDQLQHLEVLDVSDNQLHDLYGLLNLHNIRELNLNGNAGLQASDVQMLIQNNLGLTHLAVADINFGDNLGWLPPRGPQGEYDLIELDISRTGHYLDLAPLTQYPRLATLKAAGNRLLHPGPFDQLQRLEILDLSDNNLNELYDLQSLHDIRQLNLNGNAGLQAPDVQMLIQNNPSLTHLSVADIWFGSDLNWLPPTGPQGEYNLVELDISRTGHYIDLYPLVQYADLRVVRAGGNQIEYTAPFDQLQRLEALDLSDNNLNDLYGLQGMNTLRQLNLNGNSRLQSAEVQMLIQNNPGLTRLAVADIWFGTDLNWLPPSGPMGEFDLVELDISRTGEYLDLYPLTQYSNLKVIKASGNQTQYLGPLEQLQLLENIDLSDNALTDLYSLQNLHDIRRLNLNGNGNLQASDVQILIQNNPGLTRLAVADIGFGTDLNWLPPAGPMGEFDLVELDVSRTGQYLDLYPLNQYPHLKVLKAAANQIQNTGPLDQLQQLEVLDLGDNALTDLYGLQNLNGLRRLNLSGNSALLSADVQAIIYNNPGLTHLAVADIAMGNDLTWLPPRSPYTGEFNLIELDISRTGQLVDLGPVTQYENLGSLKAAGLQLQFVEPIEQLKHLETLDLRDNALVHADILSYIASLQLLDLRGNDSIPCDELDYLEASLAEVQFYRPTSCVFLNPPLIALFNPLEGEQFFTTDQVQLSADANDPEDGNLNSAIVWSSDLDGPLGNGQQLVVSLSAGQHRLTASITDSHDNETTQSVNITVLPNNPPQLSLVQPQNGLVVNAGDLVSLSAEALDAEQGDMSPMIRWTSSLDGELGFGAAIQVPLSVGQHSIVASVTDAAGVTIEQTAQVSVNALPDLTLQAPLNGAVYQQGDNATLSAIANDPEDGDLSTQIVWSSSLDGMLGNGAQLAPSLTPGAHVLTASVTDSAGAERTQSVNVTVNSAPQITLQSPADGSVFMLQEAVELTASALDPESGDISTDITWSSDIDGNLGSGATRSQSLSLGTHTLTATIADGDGGIASASTRVIVQQIELTVGVSGKGKRKTADLLWSNARTSVDIYMDNVVVDVAPASGSVQLTFKESAVFRICEAGTNYCSVDVLAQ